MALLYLAQFIANASPLRFSQARPGTTTIDIYVPQKGICLGQGLKTMFFFFFPRNRNISSS
jgi:hypothetical protein